jgi:hypothetical protein
VLRRLDESYADSEAVTGGRRRFRIEDLALNQYEQTIATEVIAPEDIRVSFNGMLYHLHNLLFSYSLVTYSEVLIGPLG